jgi:hypothetical protein
MGSNDCSRRSTEPSAGREETTDGFLVRGGDRRTRSIDRALSLLIHEWRRLLLVELWAARNSEVPVEAIVDEIVANETRPSDGGPSADLRQSIRVALSHAHIPKLDAADVVVYDRENETLRYDGDAVLNAYLDLTRELLGR